MYTSSCTITGTGCKGIHIYIVVHHIQYNKLPVHHGISWTYSYRTVNRFVGHSYVVSASDNNLDYSINLLAPEFYI